MNNLNNPQIESNPSLVLWCNLCNQRPANGVLEVLFDGQTQTTRLQACEICVIEIPDDGWLNEKNLNGKPIMSLEDFRVDIPEKQ